MPFEQVETLKKRYTDKWVEVDAAVPELRRFNGLTGQVKTVNMSGRALVQFEHPVDISWYDIDPSYLKVVDQPVKKKLPASMLPRGEKNLPPKPKPLPPHLLLQSRRGQACRWKARGHESSWKWPCTRSAEDPARVPRRRCTGCARLPAGKPLSKSNKPPARRRGRRKAAASSAAARQPQPPRPGNGAGGKPLSKIEMARLQAQGCCESCCSRSRSPAIPRLR